MARIERTCEHGIPFSEYCQDCDNEEYEDDGYEPDWDEDSGDWYDDPSDPEER